MEKRDKMIICGIFIIIAVFFIFLNLYIKYLSHITGLDFQPIKHSTSIEFREVNQTIYVTSRQFGLGGQHYNTVISNVYNASNKKYINKEKDIVLDGRCGLYYKKQEPDSLFIFLPSYSYTEERESYRQISNIKIKIMEVKNKTYNNFKNNYKTLELVPILCVDSN